ncbi:acylphosphatase [Formivibrio citricus]|uniref:Acylphosphatase n=1 Tax=Formivibrio citricus TaxID=83765 RepID=A0A1I4X7H3_9NEIS|nr:acylphosphatase [Formivibrio citricus]SFN21642.1 acylphosphatase [Formivibrio citricus]
MIAKRIRIYGRVQGVGFRWSTCREARRLGVKGWVRNRDDGSVEIHAQGNAESIAALEAWATQGPPAARVDRMEATAMAIELFDNFMEYPNG